MNSEQNLSALHHIAISVENISDAIAWYQSQFRCEVVYQDETWGMLQFANIQMALVLPGQHPPHLGFAVPNADDYGTLKTHRDGSRSIYTSDPFGNVVELLDDKSL